MPSARMNAITLASVASPAPIVSMIGAASDVAGRATLKPERVNTFGAEFSAREKHDFNAALEEDVRQLHHPRAHRATLHPRR